MSKNYMPEVARMLGVEINEEFDLIYETGQKSDWGPYKITRDGLVDESGNWTLNETAILNLLKGNYNLQKRPWRPKEDSKYYTISLNGRVTWCHFYKDEEASLALLNMGNCFPTKEAAEAAVPEMLAKFEEIKKGGAGVMDTEKEHPAETYKDVFLERFPDAKVEHGGTPCPCIIYIFGEKAKPINCGTCGCVYCWNREAKETYD